MRVWANSQGRDEGVSCVGGCATDDDVFTGAAAGDLFFGKVRKESAGCRCRRGLHCLTSASTKQSPRTDGPSSAPKVVALCEIAADLRKTEPWHGTHTHTHHHHHPPNVVVPPSFFACACPSIKQI